MALVSSMHLMFLTVAAASVYVCALRVSAVRPLYERLYSSPVCAVREHESGRIFEADLRPANPRQ